MSAGRLPDRIDPLRYARERRILEGSLDTTAMRRLASSLAGPSGMVDVRVEFGVDSDGTRYAAGHIDGTLVLECQRCLGPMDFPVSTSFNLGIVTHPSLADRLPEHYDPLVMEGDEVSLNELVEDELLLALPVVARHETVCTELPGSSEEQDEPEEQPRENPFAVLANLKSKTETNED